MNSKEIEHIANRLFQMFDWIEKFGKPIYYIKGPESIRSRFPKQPLPDDWEIITHQKRIFIFLSKEKSSEEQEHTLRIKMTTKQVEKVRNYDFSERGSQRRLATELGFHESHISRVRRKLMRKENVKPEILSSLQRKSLYVSRKNVIKFFENMNSAQEWFKKYGKTYHIKHLRYLYPMMKSGNPELPDNWKSIRIGKYWYLYKLNFI